jgi:two-component system, OmpR family, alkaline phosphatase synthesis response regulator PhoP
LEKILVIDDERSVATLLRFNLGKAGYYVITSFDGFEGLDLARKEAPDLILLDLMLPGLNGLDICKKLRMERNDTPILILTAKDSEKDKILGLEMGADDYVTKPFHPREVVARVKAILRRTKKRIYSSKLVGQEKVYTIGPFQIDPKCYEVKINSQKLELTPSEFHIFLYFLKHHGRTVKREQLLSTIKRVHQKGNLRAVDTHIYHLRKKLEVDPEQPQFIKTVRGIGYTFEL